MKSIPYLSIRSVFLLSPSVDFKAKLKQTYPQLRFDKPPYDLIMVGKDHLEGFDFKSLEADCHNDSIILLEGIHGSPSKLNLWNALKVMPEFTVSIDYYFGGIL